jgi:TPR repeat protein
MKNKFKLLLLGVVLLVPPLAIGQTDDGTAEYTEAKKYQYQPQLRLELLQTAIAKGNADAMVDMGIIYYNGYAHIKKGNYAEALNYWTKAAQQENQHGYFNLGLLYLNGSGVEKDVQKTIANWTLAANKGNTNAMAQLGQLYLQGKYLPKEVGKAHEWFKKAVDNGNTKVIPEMLTTERMVEATQTLQNPNATDFEKGVAHFELENRKEAFSWLEKAAKTGNHQAMTALGLTHEEWGDFRKYEDAAHWYKKAAKKGNEKAMYHLGKLIEKGKIGNGMIDFTDAMEWYQKAAEKEDTDALIAMGWLYNSGKHDVKPNNIYSRKGPNQYKAWDAFYKAAELGNPEGYFNLGYLLEFGLTIFKNQQKYSFEHAGEWYEKAADLGYSEAEVALERYNKTFDFKMGEKMYKNKDYEAAHKWFEKAYEKSKSMVTAMYLGELYEKGMGVEMDREKAFHYYLYAARLGDVRAKSKVTQLYDNNLKYKSLVEEFRTDVAKSVEESTKKKMAELEKIKKEEAAYQEMLYQQSLNRGRGFSRSQWEGFSYDAATKNSYNRTSAENKAKVETANFKRYLDYKFGK